MGWERGHLLPPFIIPGHTDRSDGAKTSAPLSREAVSVSAEPVFCTFHRDGGKKSPPGVPTVTQRDQRRLGCAETQVP